MRLSFTAKPLSYPARKRVYMAISLMRPRVMHQTNTLTLNLFHRTLVSCSEFSLIIRYFAYRWECLDSSHYHMIESTVNLMQNLEYMFLAGPATRVRASQGSIFRPVYDAGSQFEVWTQRRPSHLRFGPLHRLKRLQIQHSGVVCVDILYLLQASHFRSLFAETLDGVQFIAAAVENDHERSTLSATCDPIHEDT